MLGETSEAHWSEMKGTKLKKGLLSEPVKATYSFYPPRSSINSITSISCTNKSSHRANRGRKSMDQTRYTHDMCTCMMLYFLMGCIPHWLLLLPNKSNAHHLAFAILQMRIIHCDLLHCLIQPALWPLCNIIVDIFLQQRLWHLDKLNQSSAS